MTKILDLLNRQLETDLENLPLSEDAERQSVLNEIEKLHALRSDEISLNEGAKIGLKDKIEYGIKIGSIVVPLVVCVYFTNKGFRFEEEGTLTSSTFRNIWSKFRFW